MVDRTTDLHIRVWSQEGELKSSVEMFKPEDLARCVELMACGIAAIFRAACDIDDAVGAGGEVVDATRERVELIYKRITVVSAKLSAKTLDRGEHE